MNQSDEEIDVSIKGEDTQILSAAQSRLLSKLRKNLLQTNASVQNTQNFDSIFYMLKQTVEEGHNCSMMLVGRRGTSRNRTLRTIIERLKREYPPESFNSVTLNGLIHGEDERSAMKHLYKHFSELTEAKLGQLTFNDGMKFVNETLEKLAEEEKTTILILEDFDLFATLPKKQLLLYSFLDLLQQKKYRLAVVGITSRFDVMELLEKRVKSRLSQTQFIFTPSTDIDEATEIVHKNMLVSNCSDIGDDELCTVWNTSINKLFKSQSVIEILHGNWMLWNDIRRLNLIMFMALMRVNMNQQTLSEVDIQWANDKFNQDPKEDYLMEATPLDLSLIIAAKHLEQKEFSQFSFDNLYQEQREFSSRYYTPLNVDRGVAWKAFERLVEAEFVLPVTEHQFKGNRQSQPFRTTFTREQIIAGLNRNPDCPTKLQKWGTNWVE